MLARDLEETIEAEAQAVSSMRACAGRFNARAPASSRDETRRDPGTFAFLGPAKLNNALELNRATGGRRLRRRARRLRRGGLLHSSLLGHLLCELLACLAHLIFAEQLDASRDRPGLAERIDHHAHPVSPEHVHQRHAG